MGTMPQDRGNTRQQFGLYRDESDIKQTAAGLEEDTQAFAGLDSGTRPTPSPSETRSSMTGDDLYLSRNSRAPLDGSMTLTELFGSRRASGGSNALSGTSARAAMAIAEGDETSSVNDPRPLTMLHEQPDSLGDLGQSSLSVVKAAMAPSFGSASQVPGMNDQSARHSSNDSSGLSMMSMISGIDGASFSDSGTS